VGGVGLGPRGVVGGRVVLGHVDPEGQGQIGDGGPGRADDRVDVLWRTDLATAFRRIMPQLV